MKRGSEWLSAGAELLAKEEDAGEVPQFDLLVVGSGYGGAVVAARVAKEKPEWRVAVLERGLEYLPGDFPKTFDELPAHVRWSGGHAAGIRGQEDGLFDMRIGEDVDALVACGLGGGSLINAGVAERADGATLADPAWPAPWRGDARLWDSLYARAADSLGAGHWPSPVEAKGRAMAGLAGAVSAGERVEARAEPVRLTIEPPEQDTPGHVPPLKGCLQCGDCFTGCNVGAKRTLGTSYLVRAVKEGARLYTGATVLHIERSPRGQQRRWTVRWVLTDPKRLPGRAQPYRIRADRVVLCAGTFGSTEILLRSSARGLRLSSQLGDSFSTNGDVIGAQYGLRNAVESFARVEEPLAKRRVGPTITHFIQLDRADARHPKRRLVIEDLTVPAALQWVYSELLASLMVPQAWTHFEWRTWPRPRDPAVVDDARGGRGLGSTLLVAAMGHDGAKGKLQLLAGYDDMRQDGNTVVHWPGAGRMDAFTDIDERLHEATRRQGATWLRSPMWQAAPDSPLIDKPEHRKLFTVHPLGGCRMAETMCDGVVDPFGHVFDAGTSDPDDDADHGREFASREDRRIHEGLCVLDGAVIPTSLGINPLLTITALAEGIVDRWMEDWSSEPIPEQRVASMMPAALAAWPARKLAQAWPAEAPCPTRLSFTERMKGLVQDVRLPSSPPACIPTAQAPLVRLSLKFDFEAIDDAQAFVRQRDKCLRFSAQLVLAATWWDDDRQREVEARPGSAQHARLPVTGAVTWFGEARTCFGQRIWHTLETWWVRRRKADMYTIDVNGRPKEPAGLREALGRLVAFVKVLTNFGAPRLLAYRFDPLPGDVAVTLPDGRTFTLPQGTRLDGAKVLVYESVGHPGQQLSEMTLFMEPPNERRRSLALLRFDPLFMLGRDELPLRIERQHDALTGLRDAGSIAAYFGRVVFGQHYLSFRRPDYAAYRPKARLPAVLSTQEPGDIVSTPIDLVFTRPGDGRPPIRLRLTRVQVEGMACSDPVPVLFVHGFGSGGVQFTHPAIPQPMAHWFARRGRDVWVADLRTSIGLPTAAEQWSMDDVACEDIPALVDKVLARTDQPQLDVLAHCIGSAMFCMAALSGRLTRRDGTSKVRRAALMQVGPIVHLPRANRVRGYLGNRAQRFFQAGVVESTVDDRAGDSDIVLDRILGSMPLLAGDDPDEWGARLNENSPSLRLSKDLRHDARIVNAMRSAGVFGQLFQWRNMVDASAADPEQADRLLEALPDMLGPCNLTTYAQTLQYVFLRRLTDQDGRNCYVSRGNILRHFAFPVMFLQGALNDVFSPRGTFDSARLIAGVRRSAGQAAPVHRHVVEGYGHLDCVVGLDASNDVYGHLAAFLDAPVGSVAPAPAAGFKAPCIGPWLGHARWDDRGGLTLRVGLKIDNRSLPQRAIYSVVARAGAPLAATLRRHPISEHEKRSWRLAFHPAGEAVLDIPVAAELLGQSFEVWIATSDCDPALTADAVCARWQADRATYTPAPDDDDLARPIDSLKIDAAWIEATRPRPPERAQADFVLACCRNAPLLVDRERADAAWSALVQRLGDGAIQHAILVGDQVYVDSLATASAPVGSRLALFDTYREAWTSRQREVMRRIPCYMTTDDHEFIDNYGPVQQKARPRAWRNAFGCMKRYQYAAGPIGPAVGGREPGELGFEWCTAGVEYRVLDTRTGRRDTPDVLGASAQISSDAEFQSLAQWLARTKGKLRVLVMSTPPAPVFLKAVAPAYRGRCDDWQRFPASRVRLFDLLYEDGCGHLLVLAGDYHCFTASRVRIDKGEGKVVSFPVITTSGLYCPYPFANTDREELWEGTADAWLDAPPYRWTYAIERFEAGSGYTHIRLRPAGSPWMEYSFERVD
jgi:choline dehydrogenase-like flavoprotein